ncbi:Cingulin [Talaromyces islandicus]|uniref:Cingulin n=1 Tax=Talaromyces islandicus TaxID=28573 RepID=A0A0U1LQE3_TALIS|nr:Cingulin [Talaromyces islandicus]
MSTTPKKPTNGATGPGSKERPAIDTNRVAAKSPANGLHRTPSGRASPVSARAAARKPGRSNLSVSSVPKIASSTDASDDEARAQNAALIEELKEQLQKAETASEQYQKQLGVLQMRLDEAVAEQAKLEDQAHEKDSKLDALGAEIRDHARQLREMEQAHDQDRTAMLQDKEQQASREEELHATIQRLKETIAQKDIRVNADSDKEISRSSSFRNRPSPDVDNGQFAPSSQLERSPSRNNAKLLLQKDKLIESLRLELAESQIKLVEMENKGGGRQQELERELLEARMANARLMEDNESYQLLLSEKTLNGDFTKGDFLHDAAPAASQGLSGSLADELESVGEGNQSETRKLEGEVKALKDQNKALTLYIERIIGRLLQHEGFEQILDKNDSPLSLTGGSNTDKELPPPPPEKDAPSLLQRAKSVVTGQGNRPQPKPRPMSHMPPPTSVPSAHENPNTAPSIPLGRSQSVRTGHRRSRSDQLGDGTAAAVVGQMYRGLSGTRSPSGAGPLSPTTMGPGSRHSGFFGAAHMSNETGRTPSLGSQPDRKRLSSSDSMSSDVNADVSSLGATSTPPSRPSSGMNNYTGAVMTQNRLRPLRLVRENQEEEEELSQDDEAANKKANRASWISWFNRPQATAAPATTTLTQEETPKP